VHVIACSRRLKVTGGGMGVVAHAGLVLLRMVADRTGLTEGLSGTLASDRLLAYDGGGCWRTWRARSPTARR
jgi:hypothetical protein